MGITLKIHTVRRKNGSITVAPARAEQILSHAHRSNTSLSTMLSSYNNCSESALDEAGEGDDDNSDPITPPEKRAINAALPPPPVKRPCAEAPAMISAPAVYAPVGMAMQAEG